MNERSAATCLRLITSSEFDFRANDRDKNGVQDFWTGDVCGLFRVGLIDRSIAEADARPLIPLGLKPVPHNGYFFAALDLDESETPPEPLWTETDKHSGKVHHSRKFAFVAYPSEPGVTGNYMYIINENATDFRTYTFAVPVPRNWPSDSNLVYYWAKYD